jgi:hypothetical protein
MRRLHATLPTLTCFPKRWRAWRRYRLAALDYRYGLDRVLCRTYSWKHARAVAQFDVALAASQVRLLFDYQSAQPGAAYAGMTTVGVWRANPADKLVAREMLPKLLAYHRWWYGVRDHDKSGRTEFGSSSNNSVCMGMGERHGQRHPVRRYKNGGTRCRLFFRGPRVRRLKCVLIC